MDFARMKISEITSFLSARTEPLSPEQVWRLAGDRRRGVRAALQRYLEARRAEEGEQVRLHNMLALERELYARGYRLIAGVDEAGRGPLAGPVVAAAVVLPPGFALRYLDDSKKLTAARRDALFKEIVDIATAVNFSIVDCDCIDRININRASLLAMHRAVSGLQPAADYLLVDGRQLIEAPLPQSAVVGGDGRSLSIAAASVVAKVVRDRIMEKIDRLYPCFGFARHKGYPTPEHRAAILTQGLSPVHRRSFRLTAGDAHE